MILDFLELFISDIIRIRSVHKLWLNKSTVCEY